MQSIATLRGLWRGIPAPSFVAASAAQLAIDAATSSPRKASIASLVRWALTFENLNSGPNPCPKNFFHTSAWGPVAAVHQSRPRQIPWCTVALSVSALAGGTRCSRVWFCAHNSQRRIFAWTGSSTGERPSDQTLGEPTSANMSVLHPVAPPLRYLRCKGRPLPPAPWCRRPPAAPPFPGEGWLDNPTCGGVAHQTPRVPPCIFRHMLRDATCTAFGTAQQASAVVRPPVGRRHRACVCRPLLTDASAIALPKTCVSEAAKAAIRSISG